MWVPSAFLCHAWVNIPVPVFLDCSQPLLFNIKKNARKTSITSASAKHEGVETKRAR